MNRFLLCLILSVPATAGAQHWPRFKCADAVPCDKPVPQQQYAVQQPQGVFVAPPATGTVHAPLPQYGLEGGAITLPEITFKFPSFRLPGVSHSVRSAYMQVAPATAPYVEQPLPVSQLPLQQAPQLSATSCGAEQRLQQLEQAERQLLQRLETLRLKLREAEPVPVPVPDDAKLFPVPVNVPAFFVSPARDHVIREPRQ